MDRRDNSELSQRICEQEGASPSLLTSESADLLLARRGDRCRYLTGQDGRSPCTSCIQDRAAEANSDEARGWSCHPSLRWSPAGQGQGADGASQPSFEGSLSRFTKASGEVDAPCQLAAAGMSVIRCLSTKALCGPSRANIGILSVQIGLFRGRDLCAADGRFNMRPPRPSGRMRDQLSSSSFPAPLQYGTRKLDEHNSLAVKVLPLK